MSKDWAEENLKIIRTLMERASQYRLALAPISIIVGILGIVAATVTRLLGWSGSGQFAGYWMVVAVIVGGITLILIRRQAMMGGERFISAPAKRVAQSMAPLFVAGLGFWVLELYLPIAERDSIRLAGLWMISYGGGIHAAGSEAFRVFVYSSRVHLRGRQRVGKCTLAGRLNGSLGYGRGIWLGKFIVWNLPEGDC